MGRDGRALDVRAVDRAGPPTRPQVSVWRLATGVLVTMVLVGGGWVLAASGVLVDGIGVSGDGAARATLLVVVGVTSATLGPPLGLLAGGASLQQAWPTSLLVPVFLVLWSLFG